MPSRIVPPITASQPPTGTYGVALPVMPFAIGTSVSAAIAPLTVRASPSSTAEFDPHHAKQLTAGSAWPGGGWRVPARRANAAMARVLRAAITT